MMSPRSLPRTAKDWLSASTMLVSSTTIITIMRIATGMRMMVIESIPATMEATKNVTNLPAA